MHDSSRNAEKREVHRKADINNDRCKIKVNSGRERLILHNIDVFKTKLIIMKIKSAPYNIIMKRKEPAQPKANSIPKQCMKRHKKPIQYQYDEKIVSIR